MNHKLFIENLDRKFKRAKQIIENKTSKNSSYIKIMDQRLTKLENEMKSMKEILEDVVARYDVTFKRHCNL